ncbi:MAG TPA: TIGR03435 family protein [Bryobacteraceae bacterium]|nr:TIGR03435 family protein [Bryobacteraceae bacterium]
MIRVSIVLAALAGLATADLHAQPAQAASPANKPSFEAISIRPGSPDSQGHFSMQNGRLSGAGLIWTYIISAWNIMPSRDQLDAMIAPLPKWVSTDVFEINAVAPGSPSPDQMRLMLQALLADRFKLQVHFETGPVPVLALVPDRPGRTGPNIRPHAEGPACDVHLLSQTRDPAGKTVDVFPPVCGQFSAADKPNRIVLVGARNVTVAQIAEFISSLGRLDRPVVDHSGFSGSFDFTLEFTKTPKGSSLTQQDGSDESRVTTLQEALQEQLGLKLKATTAPQQTLVIDHVERPSAN